MWRLVCLVLTGGAACDEIQQIYIFYTFKTLIHTVKNGQAYLQNLAVFTPQAFLSIFNHFSIAFMEGLKYHEG